MSYNLYQNRHIGSTSEEQQQMLSELGYSDIDSFIEAVIPDGIKSAYNMLEGIGCDEATALHYLRNIANQNKVFKNYIGMGYYDTITPSVIKRNVFENPGWYTPYTPYQAEISQGRLESLLTFQQMIMDLSGFNLANASLLDEATAAAESVSMARKLSSSSSNKFLISDTTFPQTIDVVKTRANYQNIEIVVFSIDKFQQVDFNDYFGILMQNPDFYGDLRDYSGLIHKIKSTNKNCIVSMCCDILSLVLFKSPKDMGADIAIGSTQRFGIPIGFGGPSAAYIATHESNKRIMPGRIIGVTKDSNGKHALRMSLQTREQHIRREKATSNICTSQALLANMAAFYAMYHGIAGLTEIAQKINNLSVMLLKNFKLSNWIHLVTKALVFDTIVFSTDNNHQVYERLLSKDYAIGSYNGLLFISLGESSTLPDVVEIFNIITNLSISVDEFVRNVNLEKCLKVYDSLVRSDQILTHNIFNTYHSETKMMRYLKKLENKDISLTHSMIPLGSCTMKLNAASTLEGISWSKFSNIHPFAPKIAAGGYFTLLDDLKNKLERITGFDKVSLQPNSGAQGEFAGLIAIRRYHESIGQGNRNICLIPESAHGTNPASAQIVGLSVVVVKCDEGGNVDTNDLQKKVEFYKDSLSCLMITYPSTHGVFEANIKLICDIVHKNGGQVYLDGANLNAMIGIAKPADLGADVSHINLHKTFAIPHGGGGPGMGPIGVKEHLAEFLPGHVIYSENSQSFAVSSSPFGSASIIIISWMYITMLGEAGLKYATYNAILNANYIAHKLTPYYKILYTGKNSLVAHECIIDLREFKDSIGITEVDFAKRLIDFGFHPPTMSFPVPGTLMVEPTESEDKAELDRFIDAMVKIHKEVKLIKEGFLDKANNVLKNAPHTLANIINWDKPYSIEDACFPLQYLKESKIFASINRIDDAYGDRNFLCSCFDFNSYDYNS